MGTLTSQENPWALILGGSSGIGRATAQKMAAHGWNLVILHRDRRQQLPALADQWAAWRQQGVQVNTYNLDALKKEVRDRVIQDLQAEGISISLVVHAIAKGNLKPLRAEDESPVLDETDLQLTGQAMASSLLGWTQALYRGGCFASRAQVIGLTSEGQYRVWPGYAAVAAAKASLQAIVRALAVAYGPQGVRANLIQAGITDTPSLRMIPGSEHLLEKARARNPLGRITQPEDIANAIYLLCQPEAQWINGALIPVDGGESLR